MHEGAKGERGEEGEWNNSQNGVPNHETQVLQGFFEEEAEGDV